MAKELEDVKSGMMDAVKTDVTGAKIDRRVNSVNYTDGKIHARYSVSGLPTKKDKNVDYVSESSYRDYDKIFDTWTEFAGYTEALFTMSTEELLKLK